jgi:multiple sugar transport system substrate-binding protein
MSHEQRPRRLVTLVVLSLLASACSGTASSTATPGAPQASTPVAPASAGVPASAGPASSASASAAAVDTTIPSGPYTLKVAFSSNYEFDTPDLTTQWWNEVTAAYKAQHPNATIQFIPIPGNYVDIVTKLSLLYRSPSTAPDIAEIPNELVSAFAQAGYLQSLNGYVTKTAWWSDIPPVVQNEDSYQGNVYAVSHGENTNALLYRQDMFQKAGISMPWQPKTWQDILDAATKVKAAVPGVWPLWLNAGTSEGANDEAKGINNFIAGTKDPTIQDPTNGKFVVDSPGIRDALSFYQQAFSQGLTPPVSVLFGSSAVTDPTNKFPDGKVAIAVATNFYGGQWSKFVAAPYWADAPKLMGMAYLPSNYDPSLPASTLGGLGIAVSSSTKYPQAAFDFIDAAQSEKNIIDAANWGGWIPPEKSDWTDSAYTDFAPPFNEFFATVLPYAQPAPASADYAVWAQGMGTATGAIAQNPSTTVDEAVKMLVDYVTSQLGADKVETRP